MATISKIRKFIYATIRIKNMGRRLGYKAYHHINIRIEELISVSQSIDSPKNEH